VNQVEIRHLKRFVMDKLGATYRPLANLSRLVIDPYREACKLGWRLGERLALDIPFFVAGFDAASEELKVAVDRGVVAPGAACLGATRPGPNAPWLQLCEPGRDAPSHDSAGVVYWVDERWDPMPTERARNAGGGVSRASRRGHGRFKRRWRATPSDSRSPPSSRQGP